MPVLPGVHSCSVTAGCSGTIWLTPLLGEQDVRRMIEAGTRPTLLIGSTSDPTWAEPPRTAGGVRQLVVEGLDHGLEAAGSVARSLAVLGQVAAAIDEFLAEAERAGGHGQVSAMT